MKPSLPAVAARALAALSAVAALSALGQRTTRESVVRGPSPSTPRALGAPCPPGTLPDEGVCVPVPAPGLPTMETRATREEPMAERVPRRPDRDADYGRYELPVARGAEPRVTTAQAAQAAPGPDGGAALGGLLVTARSGAPVSAVTLDGQEGPALVVYAGPLVGGTLVTLHAVHEQGRERAYLVVIGNLAPATGPALAPRAELRDGAPVGVTTLAPLYLDVRLVRARTDVWSLAPRALVESESSVPIDPRNVLRRLH